MSRKLLLFGKKMLLGFSTVAIMFTVAGSCDVVTYAKESSDMVELMGVGNGVAVPYSDIIEYRYKVIDGNLYRRLYNYSRQFWIGEWELILEVNN